MTLPPLPALDRPLPAETGEAERREEAEEDATRPLPRSDELPTQLGCGLAGAVQEILGDGGLSEEEAESSASLAPRVVEQPAANASAERGARRAPNAANAFAERGALRAPNAGACASFARAVPGRPPAPPSPCKPPAALDADDAAVVSPSSSSASGGMETGEAHLLDGSLSGASCETSCCASRQRVQISVGELPVPFSLECVASRGLSSDALCRFPRDARLLEASCMRAELRVGAAVQPVDFWGALVPDEAARAAVAPEHFGVVMDEAGLRLQILSSHDFSTSVNGERVRDQKDLQPGDVISITTAPHVEAAVSFLLATFDCDPAVIASSRDLVYKAISLSGGATGPKCRDGLVLSESTALPLLVQSSVQLDCTVS